ncbi:hypothetical protein RIF29_39320 [Crotalaria pallida]|uniref:Acyl-CoA oxidase C-alpha1 domain-containing protein n=1 Tax=Crotalaria pallida TaxID=3830 RepID=A0AAN9E3F3_CROPI
MLRCKVSQVTREGKYAHSGVPRQLIYGTMVAARKIIVLNAFVALSRAVCIATRYSAVPRQFGSQNEAEEQQKNVDSTAEQTALTRTTGKAEARWKNVKDKSSNSSSTEQDLDTFLLGDLEDIDDAPKHYALISELTCRFLYSISYRKQVLPFNKDKGDNSKTGGEAQKSSPNVVVGDPLGDAHGNVQDEIIKEFAAIMATGTMRASEAVALGITDTLGTELFESLLKMAPSKEEERKLKEHKDDSPTKLGLHLIPHRLRW